MDGIAGYDHATRARAFAGVFLGANEPVDPAPARLHYADSEFDRSTPAVGQMFVIGDGRKSDGTLQQFVVPAGATRLFFGITDVCADFIPGCFDDNSGAYNLTGEIAFH